MSMIKVSTQAALGEALKSLKSGDWIACIGSGEFLVTDSASVRASKYVSVHTWKNLGKPKVSGGVLIEVPEITTAKEWCDYYGVEVKRGIAVLFKGVDDDYSTDYARAKGIFYKPGTKPTAPDWGGKAECGGGLHFSPRPMATLVFNADAKHFVACPVRVSEIVVHKDAQYPAKVKAPRVVGPCFEVDIHGEPIGSVQQ